MNDRIIAAFDVGSNSIKMTVARRGPADTVEEFIWRSETVRLGQGIEETNRLADDRIAAALDTLTRFVQEARAAGATRLIGVATEATRVTENGAAFLGTLIDRLGIDMQTISGDREAELTFLGLDGVADLSGLVLVADIGGGSTELVLADERRVIWSASYALGSGRLTDRYLRNDPPTFDDVAACIDHAGRAIADAGIARRPGGRLIVVGGTGEYLDRLLAPGRERTPDLLVEALARLTTLPAAAIAPMIGASEARARVLPAGIAIAEAVARRARPASVTTAVSGIRRGLLLAAFAGEL